MNIVAIIIATVAGVIAIALSIDFFVKGNNDAGWGWFCAFAWVGNYIMAEARKKVD